MHGADGGLIHSSDDCGTTGGTNSGGGVGIGVADSFLGELVKVGSDGLRVTVTAEVGIDVLGGEPENIGPWVGLRLTQSREGAENEEEKFHFFGLNN